VCPVLLQKLSFVSGGPMWDCSCQQDVHRDHFRDPFTNRRMPLPSQRIQNLAKLVLFYDSTFVVLCPGEKSGVLSISRSAGGCWKDTPFVADDVDLQITMSLHPGEHMRLDRGQAMPAIMEYDGQRNHIVDFGRVYP